MKYTEEIKKHIISEITQAFNFWNYPKNRKNLTVFKNGVQEWLDECHKQELCPKFEVKIKKLPRKLKKQYFKKGIVPLEIVEIAQIKTMNIEIEVK